MPIIEQSPIPVNPRVLMSRVTGKAVYDLEHLRQSIIDILTTRKGSRLMRRDYGSNLYLLLDRPITPRLITALYAETIQALTQWEPRITVTKVRCDATGFSEGVLVLDMDAIYKLDRNFIRLENLSLDFKAKAAYQDTLT